MDKVPKVMLLQRVAQRGRYTARMAYRIGESMSPFGRFRL
jgi:hypothetical protein